MNASHWTFKASGVVLALVIAILAANPAVAEKNNGDRPPTFRERIDAAREGCKKSGGTFTMTIEVSQGRAHAKCAEKDGTSTDCTITMSYSVCENKPAQNATGPGWARPVGDIPMVEAEITQVDGQWSLPGDAQPGVVQDLTVAENVDPGTASPMAVEAETAPIQPVEAAPLIAEETEDEDA